jgi:hypothetical protein
MIKMDEVGFKQNLEEALEFHDAYLSNEELKTFMDLNFDEDGYLAEWSFSEFNSFALDVATEGIKRACHLNDLNWSEDKEDF